MDTWATFLMFHLLIFALCLVTVRGHTVLAGREGVLPCVGNADITDQYTWIDLTENGRIIYIVRENSETKSAAAIDESKYDNFSVDNGFPTSVNMSINPVTLQHIGDYQCQLFNVRFERVVTLEVEAQPQSVSISCTHSSQCGSRDESASTVTCTCTAVGAYPESLMLEWMGYDGEGTTVKANSSMGPPGTFDFTSIISLDVEEDNPVVSCNLTGYSIAVEERDRSHTYLFSPPSCSLEIDCSEAIVTCNCINALPEEIKYTFYDKDIEPINLNPSTSNKMNVEIMYGESNTFHCWGCNGIYYGNNSFVNSTVYCPSTTTIPSTTTDSTTVPTLIDFTSRSTKSDGDYATTPTPVKTEMPPPTEPPLPVYVIIIIVICVVILLVVIIILVYWFVIRPSSRKRSVKGSNNEVGISTANKEKSDKLLYESTGNNFDPPGGADNNTVTASTNETTNSAAPVYGVVNKSTKKKSDNTDGNGVNSKLQSEPDRVEYAAVNKPESDPQPAPRSSKPPGNNTEPEKMELQYADIDHSNRGRSNEIHQPADAPTEYATVQSVIV